MKCWCCEASAPEIGELPLPVCETCKESMREFGDVPKVIPTPNAHVERKLTPRVRLNVLEIALGRGCRFEVDHGVLRIEGPNGIQFLNG